MALSKISKSFGKLWTLTMIILSDLLMRITKKMLEIFSKSFTTRATSTRANMKVFIVLLVNLFGLRHKLAKTTLVLTVEDQLSLLMRNLISLDFLSTRTDF